MFFVFLLSEHSNQQRRPPPAPPIRVGHIRSSEGLARTKADPPVSRRKFLPSDCLQTGESAFCSLGTWTDAWTPVGCLAPQLQASAGPAVRAPSCGPSLHVPGLVGLRTRVSQFLTTSVWVHRWEPPSALPAQPRLVRHAHGARLRAPELKWPPHLRGLSSPSLWHTT